MSAKKSKLWYLAMVLCVAILSGCDPKEPKDPPVARRHNNGVKIGSVNSQSATDGENSRPDGDLYCSLWARFMINDDPIQLGNQKVDVKTTFTWDTGAGSELPRITYRTNRRGYAIWNVPFNAPASGSFSCGFYTKASCPRTSTGLIGTFARVASVSHSPGYMDPLDYPLHPSNYNYAGTYWMSCSQIGDGHLTLGQMAGPPRKTSTLLPATSTDDTFLNTEPNVLFNDVIYVADCFWEFLDADNQPQPVTQFEPIDDFRSDPNYAQLITENSTPYFMKWHFWTKAPCSLAGRIFAGTATIGNSDPNYTEPVSITVLSDSTDRRSHVAVSEYMVIADPNGYAPFRVDDIMIVPLETGQRIRIVFNDLSQVVSMAAEKWLTDDADFDINKDGIFNFKDW